ncbi:MAG: glycine oxidase ThiO [Gammaproteobacteria bacterium]|nr:MAG: glycine oxidase ThiO [Gammaproteobacteria bacterium]
MQDCIVVGGGLIGMLSARMLAGSGRRVVLLERGEPGQEASWAGGGILSPLYPWRYPQPVNALAAWSQQRYPDLCAELHEETGIDPEWTQSGLLMVAPEDAAEGLAWARAQGVRMEQVAPGEARAIEPALGADAPGGLWMPEIAQLRNPRMLKALRHSLELRGVELRAGYPVEEVLHGQGRVQGVRGPWGELRAEQVLVCGGAWSARLVPLAQGEALPVTPVRGQMILYRARPGLLQRILLHEGRYLIPRRDGHIVVGSTMERVGYDKSVTDDARAALQQAAESLVPALAGQPVVRHWAGLRPGSPQGVPFIGPHPEIDGLFVNSGHFRNGVVMGPASCALVASLMNGVEPPLNEKPYQLRAGLQKG